MMRAAKGQEATQNARLIPREYDARIRRAEQLGAKYPFATQVLTFYREVLTYQKSLATQIVHGPIVAGFQSDGARGEIDLSLLLPHFRNFLGLIETKAPRALANVARQLTTQPSNIWVESLNTYWQCGGRMNVFARNANEAPQNRTRNLDNPLAALERFFPQAFLQPYAELSAKFSSSPALMTAPKTCPICGGLPLLGVLRPEGDGGKRFLVCSFCLSEWEFRRILCSICGEETEQNLPVYIAEQFPHIRVETCDTCKFYLRTIDLTKDGHAVPLVDDLTAIPLTLWAQEHGYSRLPSNLLGT